MPLHIPTFAGGIALEGSADSQRTDEVGAADAVDIGPRGALIVASAPTDYLELDDNGTPAPWSKLWAILESSGFNFSKVIAVGEGRFDPLFSAVAYIITSFNREGEASPYPWGATGNVFDGELGTLHPRPVRLPNGIQVTACDFSGVFVTRFGVPGVAVSPSDPVRNLRIYLINLGAREGTAPNLAPGLYVATVLPPSTVIVVMQIGRFDALGTGSAGLLAVPTSYRSGEGGPNYGSSARQLFPRGIVAYNNHVFAWGFDASDERMAHVDDISNAASAVVTTAAPHGYATGDAVTFKGAHFGFGALNGQTYAATVTGPTTFTIPVDTTAFGAFAETEMMCVVGQGDGSARVMFSNLGNPLKWGNDNVGPVGTDRVFTDSDAIVLGDAGEIIRAAINWAGKLFFGTNKGLHYIGGYGRDSFLTDGATPIMRAYNVVGPHALIEGPDKSLYGVCEEGLWVLDAPGGVPRPLFKQLRDFAGRSNGYWDLIWTDLSRGTTYPGQTNRDLVWMTIDWEQQQVVIGIPWCSIANGFGYGEDTVVLKYHVIDGGFTRQQFPGVQYTAAGYFRSQVGQKAMKFLGTATSGKSTVQRVGYKATGAGADAPVLPSQKPVISFGPYAPFGPDGKGVVRRLYLTLAWERRGSYDNPLVPVAISSITKANPAVVTTLDPHNLKSGQIVDISETPGVSIGMKQIVGGPYTITVTGPTTFQVNGVNSTGFSSHNAFGVVSFPLSFALTMAKDGDGFDAKTLSVRHVPPSSPLNGDLWVDTSGTDPNMGNFASTTLFASRPAFLLKTRKDHAPIAMTGATKANPCVITAPAHGKRTGERVSISGVAGMTQLNNDLSHTKDYTITVIDADHFSLDGIDSSGYGAYTSGGSVSSAWQLVPGLGGTGYRVTVPIPLARVVATRITMALESVILSKRYQIEGLGIDPAAGAPNA